MKFSKQKRLIFSALIFIFLLTSGLSCKCVPTNVDPQLTKPVELSYWGVWDDSDSLQPLIDDFQASHPNVKITYKKFRFAEYEQKLLEGWATDQGPDIYSIPATWINKYQNKIVTMPESVKLAFQESKTTLGKTEVQTVIKQTPTISLSDIKQKFVTTVGEDVIINDQVYGLPYSLDSLVLYYNRDLLDSSGVAVPPSNWTEMAEAVKKITKVDKTNTILQSAISLGTANNINQVFDIVSLIMMQNGTNMASNGRASFQAVSPTNPGYQPGLQALLFYTDFANPIKEVYTWNDQQPNSFDAFVSGKTAMFIGYSYYLPLIKAQAPKIDLGIAPVPQIQGAANPVNYTDYWVETVSHQTKNDPLKIDAAWGFLNFATSQDEVQKYLKKTKKPSAWRSLIDGQKQDPDISVYANQTLSATHWYKGKDVLRADQIFKDMIKNITSASAENQNAIIQQAANLINQTY